MVVLHFNGRTSSHAYVITFKVEPLRKHILAPSILPFLKARRKASVWSLPEFGRHIPFDVLYGCDTCPRETHFQSREKPKVTRSEIGRVWWLGDDSNASLGDY
jgi:hypothetical protein